MHTQINNIRRIRKVLDRNIEIIITGFNTIYGKKVGFALKLVKNKVMWGEFVWFIKSYF